MLRIANPLRCLAPGLFKNGTKGGAAATGCHSSWSACPAAAEVHSLLLHARPHAHTAACCRCSSRRRQQPAVSEWAPRDASFSAGASWAGAACWPYDVRAGPSKVCMQHTGTLPPLTPPPLPACPGARSFSAFQAEMGVLLREMLARGPPPDDDFSIAAQLYRVRRLAACLPACLPAAARFRSRACAGAWACPGRHHTACLGTSGAAGLQERGGCRRRRRSRFAAALA
jgi:hypothetical protein